MRTPTICSMLLALLALTPSAELTAQESGDPAAKLEADEHFSRGQELYAAGEYTKAAAAFELAYQLFPHQAVLGNIAMCYDKAGKLAQAVVAYRRYLADPVDAGKNTTMQNRLAELEALVGELDVECSQAGCRIEIDGIERGPAPLSVVVLPGVHKIEAFVGKQRVDKINGRVGRGEVSRFELAAEANQAPPAEEEPALPPVESETELSFGAPFWIATGICAAAGAATIVFGSLTVDAHDRYEKADRLDTKAKQDGERYRLVTNVMIGVTGAAAVAATGFAIHALVTDGGEEQVALTTGPGLGIGVEGTF